ncbi:MAG: response regulator transcription factor [Planctomycetes bacterium]|nr:response regulator transcription factor [Planctomycetota bacterium]
MTKDSHPGRQPAGVSKIIIVDDHPIVRQGLAALINQQEDMEVCAQAANGREAMEQIGKFKPDLVTIDLTLGELGGLELIKNIKSRYPDLPMLVISIHDESLYAERVLRAGARGYIMKQEATENVTEAIGRVLAGQVYVSECMSDRIVKSFLDGTAKSQVPAVGALSDRELEVFQLIGQGYGTRKIAEMLHLSIKTIETYRAHIKFKLDLDDAAHLLQYAVQWVGSQS